MKEYLAIGGDPTDTVIRDKVLEFIQKVKSDKTSSADLDRIWTSEIENLLESTRILIQKVIGDKIYHPQISFGYIIVKYESNIK